MHKSLLYLWNSEVLSNFDRRSNDERDKLGESDETFQRDRILL